MAEEVAVYILRELPGKHQIYIYHNKGIDYEFLIIDKVHIILIMCGAVYYYTEDAAYPRLVVSYL